MNSQQRRTLEFKYKPFPELVRLAWPITVSMLSYSVMTLVDTLFVGRLGAASLAGVGLGGVTFFTLLCFGIGALRAEKVLISQALGGGERDAAGAHLTSGLLLGSAVGAVALLIAVTASGALTWISESEAAGQRAADYVAIRGLSAPLVLWSLALRESRYGLGDSRSPMWAALAANVANIPLNALLIFGLGWGVKGAATATVFAQAVELGLLVAIHRREPIRLRWPSRQQLGALWALGLPSGLELFLDVGAFAALVVIIAQIGQLDLAAHQIAMQVCHLIFLPALALGDAASVLVGRLVGAADDAWVGRVAHRALATVLVYSTVCATSLMLFAELVARAFTSDAALVEVAVTVLRAAGVLQLFHGSHIVARSVLRGAGDVRYAALITVGLAWLFAPPLAYWLGLERGLGALGGWLGMCLEIALGTLLLWWRVERRGWARAAELSRARLKPAEPVAMPQPA